MEGYYIPQHPKIKAKEGNLPTQLYIESKH